MHRPNSASGTGFIAKNPNDGCIFLSALHCFLEGTEYDLQESNPAELKQMIDVSNGGLLRDRIHRYYYWFCYKKRDQHVELKGSEFVAEDVTVAYDVVSMCRTACISAIVCGRPYIYDVIIVMLKIPFSRGVYAFPGCEYHQESPTLPAHLLCHLWQQQLIMYKNGMSRSRKCPHK